MTTKRELSKALEEAEEDLIQADNENDKLKTEIAFLKMELNKAQSKDGGLAHMLTERDTTIRYLRAMISHLYVAFGLGHGIVEPEHVKIPQP